MNTEGHVCNQEFFPFCATRNCPSLAELEQRAREGSEPEAETEGLGAEPAEPGPKDAPNNTADSGSAPTGEALTDALQALLTNYDLHHPYGEGPMQEHWNTVRAALATHPSAPVAWVHPGEIERLRRGQDVQCARLWAKPHPVDTPLYTHPPAVQPVAPTGAQIRAALAHPGCDRLREWAAIGPAQRAAVELFADLLAATPSAPVAPAGMPDRLLQAGAALANCAFNLAQRGPGEFTARDIKALDQCRRAWDAARAATPSAEAQPTSKEPTP